MQAGYLSKNIACSLCRRACSPEAESATIKGTDGKVLGHLCPVCFGVLDTPCSCQTGEEFMVTHCSRRQVNAASV